MSLLVLAALWAPLVVTACTGSSVATAQRSPSGRASAGQPLAGQSSVPSLATLAGRLVASAMKTLPIPGTVTAVGPQTYTVVVGRDGRFSLTVQPGWYTVTARSPLYDDGTATCRHSGVVQVPAQASTHVEVECAEK